MFLFCLTAGRLNQALGCNTSRGEVTQAVQHLQPLQSQVMVSPSSSDGLMEKKQIWAESRHEKRDTMAAWD